MSATLAPSASAEFRLRLEPNDLFARILVGIESNRVNLPRLAVVYCRGCRRSRNAEIRGENAELNRDLSTPWKIARLRKSLLYAR